MISLYKDPYGVKIFSNTSPKEMKATHEKSTSGGNVDDTERCGGSNTTEG